ncbi:MAG: hypothetical protein HY718_01380 [Planctomycetes bacterium]|nr:hypothetical protein [Planctomycetota bacterium]
MHPRRPPMPRRRIPRCWTVPAILIAGAWAGAAEIAWQHPAGLVTNETIAEVRDKLAGHEWARKVYVNRKAALERWLAVPSAELRRAFPRQRGNVYHNFSCPADRSRLKFDPFNPVKFACPSCGKTYDAATDAGIYPAGDRYHGTMYDGWVCLFFLEAAADARDLGLIGRIEGDDRYFRRGVEILMLHADTIEKLQVRPDPDPQMRVLLTYHREGDSKVLNDLAFAYEMLRDHMTTEQRGRFETAALKRILDDMMLEPVYRYEHNNLYQWHRTIIQTAAALERDDLIDWSMGHGVYDPRHQPEHRSLRRLAATHFKPDGAFWEMCSGYHLYPLHPFCEIAVITHNLSRMDPNRFPASRYDLSDRDSPGGRAIGNALHWFVSLAMPDRTMPTVGDSMDPRAGMEDYHATAEVGYPIDNATVTKEHPPCQTLCVRRTHDAPFVAIWDAFKNSPNLRKVRWGDAGSVDLETAGGEYRIRFGPGETHFEGGVTMASDAVFACVGNGNTATFVAGSRLEYRTPKGSLIITADPPATVAAEYADGTATLEIAGDIQYDTVGGEDRYRDPPAVNVSIAGDLWRVQQREQRFAGKLR